MLWINPRTVTHHIGTNRPVIRPVDNIIKNLLLPAPSLAKTVRKKIHNYDPFVIPRFFFKKPRKISSLKKFKLIEDLAENRNDLEQSKWFHALLQEIKTRGFAKHKTIIMRNHEDVLSFFSSYILKLIASMEAQGYLPQKTKDAGTAIIGPDGEIYKSSAGNHRFFTAAIIGTSKIPLQVAGVHQQWYRLQLMKHKDQTKAIQAGLMESEKKHQ